MKVIALGHRSGVGKDTCAGFLLQELRKHGFKAKRIGFADKLKEVTFDLFKWATIKEPIYYENNREARNVIIPELGCTIVDLWVDVGEKMREIYGEIWIKNALHQEDIDFLLIPDVRHPNEISALQLADADLYRVVNPRIPPREGKSIDDYLADFENWTGDILNDGSLKKLYNLMTMMANNYAKNS